MKYFTVILIGLVLVSYVNASNSNSLANTLPKQLNRPLLQVNEEATPEEWEVARGMESMLVDQMIQEMRKSVPDNELLPKSNAERIYQQMLDTEYAATMTRQNSIGIAGLIVEQIKGRR